jgi:ParB-like chromosome segregation protein Spo0J
MKLTINPVYQKLVPTVDEDEYQSIKQSITDSGLWLPIIVNPQGVILDGHTRFKICQELGITPKHAERSFENDWLEKKFVIESNLRRRQLNDFQKSELGIPLEEINSEIAKSKMVQGGKSKVSSNEPPFIASVETAKEIGIAPSTFKRAKKIINTASEDTKDKLRTGSTTINKEYQKLQKDEKKAIRQEEIKNLQVMLPEKVTLYNSEFQKVFIEGNSVSLIFTDPPYHEKYLHLYESLAIHASRVLREGGSLICYAGHYAIGKIINMMEAQGLHFHWPIAVIHAGPSASVFGRKILVGYKPMLWFTKGKYEGEFVKDCIKSEFQGKELHEWAQSTVESDYYIKYLTLENEIVYDPFLGQGTFGISAVKLNRQFIGCEVDPEHFENARRLISTAAKT